MKRDEVGEMARLIDADKLEDVLAKHQTHYYGDSDYYEGISQGFNLARYDVKEAPTIDAELVIRCKDCNFCGEIDENGWHCCENLGVGMPKNGFCSDAERKEVEE